MGTNIQIWEHRIFLPIKFCSFLTPFLRGKRTCTKPSLFAVFSFKKKKKKTKKKKKRKTKRAVNNTRRREEVLLLLLLFL